MIDINLIRNETERVETALRKRMDEVDLSSIVSMDNRRRELIGAAEELKARRNTVSADIPRLKKAGEDVGALLAEMKEVSGSIKVMDGELRELEQSIRQELAVLPNLPDDDVPAGGKEANEELRSWGEQPAFDFPARDHVELVGMLGLVDYERGVKMGGTGFWLYSGTGARLEWALLNFFIDEHLADGYEFVLPPHILNYECGFTAGQFPKFEEDVFQLRQDDSSTGIQFILPTAETALINFHRDEILSEGELPKKYFAYTPCYRKEAGSYRSQERGMIRGHQFNKVEMFQFTRPEDSGAAIEELLGKAESLVQQLGLHYRVSKLAARDASASMAKTYDIEVWIPSMNEYKEVSSASNARDYQARRGNVRYRPEGQKRTEFIHSLNASGLATSRLIPALVEQFQRDDGSVTLPDVLADRLGMKILPTV
ncbi:MAG: serine--tRNA ligase [Spirochaetales bacterium]|nr:serine--tRNA ligase [Spirochaetales bacterium]